MIHSELTHHKAIHPLTYFYLLTETPTHLIQLVDHQPNPLVSSIQSVIYSPTYIHTLHTHIHTIQPLSHYANHPLPISVTYTLIHSFICAHPLTLTTTDSCPLSQKEKEVLLQETARQWCRIFRCAELFLEKPTGELKMLLNFFVSYPVGHIDSMHVCMSGWRMEVGIGK